MKIQKINPSLYIWKEQKQILQRKKGVVCSPEDLPEAMNDWEEWRERVRDIRAGSQDDDDDSPKP